MIFALDTNVLSALRKRDSAVERWAGGVEADATYVPAPVLMAIRYGIDRLRLRGDEAQARTLDAWLEALVHTFGGRVLDLTAEAAIVAGRLLAHPQAPGMADCMIAAVAHVHGATVVTGNARDFARTGVPWINPWDGAERAP